MLKHRRTIGPDILNAALAGLEAQRSQIEQHIAEVHAMFGGRGPKRQPARDETSTPAKPARKRRKLSAVAKSNIKAAQRKRWAAVRKRRAASKAVADLKAADKRTRTAGKTGGQANRRARATDDVAVNSNDETTAAKLQSPALAESVGA